MFYLKYTPLINNVFIFPINFYRKFISPFLPRMCRFYPTCSDYAVQALTKYNFFTALKKITIRLFKCHPFNPGGHDPLN